MPTMDNQRRGAAGSRARESPGDMRRILILGGTTEARRLAERLAHRADLAVTVSLAGSTTTPARQAVPVRIGGVGGAPGGSAHLPAEHRPVPLDAPPPNAAHNSSEPAHAAASTPRA